jgi:hypothetical protein
MEASHGSNKKSHVVLDVLGATVEFLVLPSDCEGGYCVIKGIIPPGIFVPPSQSSRRRKFFSTLRQRFAEVAARYHHWLANPEENAAVGITLL